MRDKDRTKKDLIHDLESLRSRISRLEKYEAEYKRLAGNLRESETKLRAQYRHTPVPTITWQKKGDDFVIIDYNIAADEFSKGRIGRFVGKSAHILYHDRPDILENMCRCLREKAVIRQETPYRMFTRGIERIIVFTFAFVPPDLVLSHMDDITERKTTEALLSKSERELRALSARLMTSAENERKRVAGELHDSIGQYLTTIKFNTENALGQLLQNQYVSAANALKAGVPLIRQTIDEIRKIMMDLRPTILDDLGILATLSWFCREFQTVYSDIRIERDIRLKESDIPDSLKIIIYRILQEAMNNASKHSKADRIVVSLKKTKRKIELTVSDNGRGFNVGRAIDRTGLHTRLGLVSMRERTELSGGSLTVRSRPGAGTTVLASWPL